MSYWYEYPHRCKYNIGVVTVDILRQLSTAPGQRRGTDRRRGADTITHDARTVIEDQQLARHRMTSINPSRSDVLVNKNITYLIFYVDAISNKYTLSQRIQVRF